MKKIIYVDIGELGWSLYLSAHMRWLKKYTDDYIGIMTFASRHCLYNDIADAAYEVPNDFHEKFDQTNASRFALKGASPEELKAYFAKKIPPEYEISGYFSRHSKIRAKSIFEPYPYSKKLNGSKEILVFPRFRNSKHIKNRNLSREFYAETIDILCAVFSDYIIRAIGIPSGAYNINEIKTNNYINDVKEGADLQDLIDRCQVAVAAIGSQSAPPKLTLLQGVPTFMVGHQRARHIGPDNWMSTKVEFYDVLKSHYANIDEVDCRNKIIAFVKECQ